MGFRYGGDGGDAGVGFAGPSGQIDVGDANNEGASSSAARADHQHALPIPANPPAALAAAGSAGAATRVAREDHTHAHTAAQHLAGGHADLTGDFAAVGAPAAAVAAHEGAVDPHGQYQLEATALQAAAVVLQALADAKGDIVAASGADTFARLAVGTDGKILAADSTEPLGLKWIDPPAGGATDHGALTGLGDNDHPQYLLAANARHVEAKITAGTNVSETVTWTTAFASAPIVTVSAFDNSTDGWPAWVKARSTTGATVHNIRQDGSAVAQEKCVIATGAT